MRFGIIAALLTLIYGFCLGGAFGAFENSIKIHLNSSAEKVFESKYNNEAEKVAKVTKKSWEYFKRAHLHANGLGTASLILILLLSRIQFDRRLKALVAMALGLGSLGYSMFWMFAGLMAPAAGSTSAAKESLRWLAIPSAGLCIIGLLAVSFLFVRSIFIKSSLSSEVNG